MSNHDTKVVLSSMSAMKDLTKALEKNYNITKKSETQFKERNDVKNVKQNGKAQQQHSTHCQR